MQEEVENRTLTLVVSGTKFTGRLLKAAVTKYMAHLKEKKLQKQKSRDAPVIPHGKQTVKELIGQNQGVSNIEITDPSIKEFEKIVVPKQLYVICETERMRYPTNAITELRRKMVSEWLPSSGCQLADAPEIAVTHWYYKNGDESTNQSRFIELWLPVEKK